MPTPRKKTIGVRSPDDENEVTAPHQGVDASDLSEDVERVLAEIGEAASAVIVWRMENGKPVYITRVPASEYTNEYLKTEFGGGDYKIVIVDAVQGPLNAVFLSIDRRFTGRTASAIIPSAPATSDGAFKDQLLQLLLVKMLDGDKRQSSDLDTVLRVAEVFKGGGNSDVAGQVALLMQTATTLAGAMNPPEGLAGVASQFLPVVGQIAANMQPRTVVPPARRLPPPTTPATPAPATPPASPNPSTNEGARVAGTITPAWLAPFRTVAPTLVMLADAGSDPTVYADVAIDQTSGNEELFAAAVESMNGGRLLADLFALVPALQQTEKRKAFAAELVARIEEGLRELLNAPDDNAAVQ